MYEITLVEEGGEIIYCKMFKDKEICEENLATLIEEELERFLRSLSLKKNGKEMNFEIKIEIKDGENE